MLLSYLHRGESIENCENINGNYVKPWKHNKINLKRKMPLASFEELESEDIAISTHGHIEFLILLEKVTLCTL